MSQPLSKQDAQNLQWLCDMTYVNPFGDEREHSESLMSGDSFVPRYGEKGWEQKDIKKKKKNIRPFKEHGPDTDRNPNLNAILKTAEAMSERFNRDGADFTAEQADQWFHTALFILYHRYRDPFDEFITDGLRQYAEKAKEISDSDYNPGLRLTIFRQFIADAKVLLQPLKKCPHPTPLSELTGNKEQMRWLSHIFACFFQLRRAFYNIDRYIIGSSKPMRRLRMQIWESIFTHDMQLFERTLYKQMGDYALLVTGPSGTGKELVARAVGLSRYIPFDPESLTFADCFTGSFLPLNLSAMSQTLIESELFGHKKGSYTGAQTDRKGWLEICSEVGTVFLDEIGELDHAIQVKLLRVLQSRHFSRLGETKIRTFKGKVIAATNRDLTKEMASGGFREDLFFRLCSDHIEMPSLKSRFDDDLGERKKLIQFLLSRQLEDCEPARILEMSDKMNGWIKENLGDHYSWPGNVRELEQCIRSLIIRGRYVPVSFNQSNQSTSDAQQSNIPASLKPAIDQFLQAELETEELVNIYCTIAYAKAKSYEGAARMIGMDRRTIKSRLNQEILEKLSNNI